MKYIYTFVLLVICLVTEAQGIYFLKNDKGLKPLERGSQLNLKIKDPITMDYQLTDSLGSYILYADLELYEKVGDKVVVAQKGFNIKFPTKDSIERFLKNEGILYVLKE